jgi:serine/threonine protein kinase/WD40 repeat protein
MDGVVGTGRNTTDFSGKEIKGYQLHQRIGAGRFGAVYHASQPQIHRDVAIKVIEPEYANHPEFVRTFEAEAQLIARLEHIHIVPLYDYWREPDRAFLVMRWLRGGSLRDSLMVNGHYTVEKSVRLLDQIASALALAHRKGVVHRDIKPDNILLDEENNALLTDFGIATAVIGEPTAREQKGILLGTPAYMAPELLAGEPATPQSDIYALGILLYEILTNTRPFPDDTPGNMMRQHLSAPIPSLQESGLPIPAELNMVIWRATAKAPTARYSSVIKLASAFHDAALQTPASDQDLSRLVESAAHAETEGLSTLAVAPLELENPYKGLRAFEQADADDFFGRDQLVGELIDSVGDDGLHFLALIGPSGSGKSSVVKAGLIPALRAGQLPDAQDWFTVEMVPGPDPFRELETALQSVAVNPVDNVFHRLTKDQFSLAVIVEQILPQDRPTQLLLLIDQFEEVFTLVESETTRRQFLASLNTAVQAASRLHIVITLRADFYDRPLYYEGFSSLIRRRTEVILPLSTQELKRAIENPAGCLGLIVQPELVTAIIADVSKQPGTLPLLQYALTEVFELREGYLLTLEAYRAIGGLTAALARRAEEIYSDMDRDSQELTRQLFLRLVSLDGDSEATGRRLRWSTLASLSDDQALIKKIRDTFVTARLLTMDKDPKTREPTVEVAHEALLREWLRLDKWMDTSREDIHIQRRLNVVVGEWLQADKDDGYLLTSSRLIQFEEWTSSANLHLTREEREFIDVSLAERTARQAADQLRLEREKMLERRTRNRLRVLVVVFATATIFGLLLSQFALGQQQIAESRLHKIQLLAVTDRVGLALDDDNPELALALLSSINEPPGTLPVQTQQMFYRAAYTPGARLVLNHHGDSVIGIALSPDGKLAASSSGQINPLGANVDNAVSIWNPMTGEELFHLTVDDNGPDNTVAGIAFSPDGTLLAAASADHSIYLWNVETGTLVRRLEGHNDWAVRVAFTPDGQTLISTSGNFLLTALPIPSFGTADTSVRAWDVATGEQIRIFGSEDDGHNAPVMSLAISPDGINAVTGDADGTIIVWNIATGEEIRRMESPGDWISSLAFTPDGATFLTALGKPSIGGSGASSTLMALWDIETGVRLRDYAGHTNTVITVAVSPDGRTALTGSADTSLRLWDIETGSELRRFTGHDNWVFSVAISPDGRGAISGSTD